MQTAPPKNWGRLDGLALCIAVGLALAFRLPGLTAFITADEARSWYGRSLIFFDSLLRGNLANTAPGGEVAFIENVSLSPAPGVTTMWSGTLGLILEYLRQGMPGSLTNFVRTAPFDPLDPALLFYLRLPTVLLAALAVGLTYWWSRPLLGRAGAFLAVLFIALDPFYLALSRILGHDALVTTFMWLSLLAFLRVVHERGFSPPGPPQGGISAPRFTIYDLRFTIISGACGGLAFLSKYPALFIGAFIALTLLAVDLLPLFKPAHHGPRTTDHEPRTTDHGLRTALTRWFIDITVWTLAAGAIFVLFWPAMWVNPLGPVTAIISDAFRASGGSHPKGSFFLGQPVPDPGAFFYPLIILLRTTPLTLVGLLLSFGLLFSFFKNNAKQEDGSAETQGSDNLTQYAIRTTHLTTFLVLVAYILLYTLLVTYGGKKQDRYILPAFPAIAMLAALGYLYVLRFTFYESRRITPILLTVTLLLQVLFIVPAHPYYFSFYNPLVGGGAMAANNVQVGWGEGLNEAAAYLNTLPDAAQTEVVSWYSTAFEPYFDGQAIYKIEEEKISRSAKPGLAADYVVFYINQTQRHLPSEGTLQYFQAASPVYTVTLQGIDYARIYPSVGLEHVFADEVRLVGQGELLGYDLRSETGEPVSVAYPESVLLLSLYWEWQGKVEEEPIGISLVDDTGETRGWGNHIETVAPVPFAEWQAGMVVRDEFALVIFPDTPPGEYRLAAWIDRPLTGETVGVFPVGEQETIRIEPRLVER